MVAREVSAFCRFAARVRSDSRSATPCSTPPTAAVTSSAMCRLSPAKAPASAA